MDGMRSIIIDDDQRIPFAVAIGINHLARYLPVLVEDMQ
jgi:hypothetical protein